MYQWVTCRDGTHLEVMERVKVRVGEEPMAAGHLGMERVKEMERVKVKVETGCQVVPRTRQSWGSCRGG
jgi:hypothetical protein